MMTTAGAMPENLFGDGLVFEESLPLEWLEGPLPDGLDLARLNAENHQLLGAESSLEETRVHDALKDESPALVHELQRLEFKLNILLRLTAALSAQHNVLPGNQMVRLSARGLEWSGAQVPAAGATGLAVLYINPALPQPLKLPCRVEGDRREGDLRVAQLRFVGLSEALAESIDKLIFRHHRRLVAGARHAAS